MGVLTSQDHKKKLEQQRANMEAENKWARKHLWGADDSGEHGEDEMGDNYYLGDIQMRNDRNEQKGGGLAKTLAAAGLLIGASGVPIAAYNLTRPTTAVVQPTPDFVDTNTDTKYGLRIFREEKTD